MCPLEAVETSHSGAVRPLRRFIDPIWHEYCFRSTIRGRHSVPNGKRQSTGNPTRKHGFAMRNRYRMPHRAGRKKKRLDASKRPTPLRRGLLYLARDLRGSPQAANLSRTAALKGGAKFRHRLRWRSEVERACRPGLPFTSCVAGPGLQASESVRRCRTLLPPAWQKRTRKNTVPPGRAKTASP